VIGIDDWAWKRNQRYGTIICDLERRRPIRLLPDREPATAQAWLAAQPQIVIVARDRGGAYSLAATKALPAATSQIKAARRCMRAGVDRDRNKRCKPTSCSPVNSGKGTTWQMRRA